MPFHYILCFLCGLTLLVSFHPRRRKCLPGDHQSILCRLIVCALGPFLGLRLMRPVRHRHRRASFLRSFDWATVKNRSSKFLPLLFGFLAFLVRILGFDDPADECVHPAKCTSRTNEVEKAAQYFGGRRPRNPPSTVRGPSVSSSPLGGDTDVEPCAAGEGLVLVRLRPGCARRLRSIPT